MQHARCAPQVRRKTNEELERTRTLRASSNWENSPLLNSRKLAYQDKLATLLPGCGEAAEALEVSTRLCFPAAAQRRAPTAPHCRAFRA